MKHARPYLLGLTLSLAACFGSSEQESAGLVGDWFVCDGADCARIDDDGARFQSDGTWIELDGNDQLVGDEPVCTEVSTGSGTYRFDGRMLTITTDGRETIRRAELRRDRLTLFDVQGFSSHGAAPPAEDVVMRRVTTFESERCPGDAPPQVGGDTRQPDASL